ncbi:hypothetical protein C2G38_2303382 [Gigaspora rosea]|uniref:Uncharacterized protein n=1 Tax=Gigaspora rosea TaxID=44941 RepID=A0A397VFH9_9GLOM|nr:hypothetical protein C2G38_2303382 [Gigaspora rosea]
MTTRPIWLHPQLYQKVCELQQLCNRLQYTGTIIVDPNNVTIMQDDSHTCTILADHARNITTFVDPMATIKDDLVCCSADQIFPVHVPMTINSDPNTCFREIYQRYKEATRHTNYNRIHALAYAFHMGSILWNNRSSITKPIGNNQVKTFKRVFYLFTICGYEQIYRTHRLKVKDFNDINKKNFAELVNFCEQQRNM